MLHGVSSSYLGPRRTVTRTRRSGDITYLCTTFPVRTSHAGVLLVPHKGTILPVFHFPDTCLAIAQHMRLLIASTNTHGIEPARHELVYEDGFIQVDARCSCVGKKKIEGAFMQVNATVVSAPRCPSV